MSAEHISVPPWGSLAVAHPEGNPVASHKGKAVGKLYNSAQDLFYKDFVILRQINYIGLIGSTRALFLMLSHW